ncbi:MAG TPA: transcription antitermination factor NusB [Chitinolyticbacter sp.]|uniref:transcription antitermination factor NusB n=1 Tax=Chitinolyticbacter albus TaxID=2961951 RepID=UPI00210C16F2|nr:transcription antitermination factor NusB [Chitinolyticbacter albus]HSC80013.1 transcription antitermination factor NusB [Chitinolyticbacter sp.]
MTEEQHIPVPAEPAKPKSARRRAREFAVQGIYQWQLTGDTVNGIERYLKDSTSAFGRADEALFRTILYGVLKEPAALQSALEPHIDRPFDEVSPVEAAVLFASAFEILHTPETPYPVIVNEAIELAKTFGGTDGHKFVNGVLDKLAGEVRPAELQAVRAKRRG